MDGHRLRMMRVQLKLSQDELAELLDVTQNTISRWESGAVQIRHGRILERAMWDVAREVTEQLARKVEPADGG